MAPALPSKIEKRILFMAENQRHILSSFDNDLETLRERLLAMAILTHEIVKLSLENCFLQDDQEACRRTIDSDSTIDRLEKEVDQCGLDILIRYHPVAGDLRLVISTMRVSQNFERIADHAVGVARKVKKLDPSSGLAETALLEPLYRETLALLRDAIHAFTGEDVALAHTLKERDQSIDAHHARISNQLAELMTDRPEKMPVYLALLFVARHLERIADLATYIGADAVFAASAVDIRHTSSAPALSHR